VEALKRLLAKLGQSEIGAKVGKAAGHTADFAKNNAGKLALLGGGGALMARSHSKWKEENKDEYEEMMDLAHKKAREWNKK
jgi:hypothetical protein